MMFDRWYVLDAQADQVCLSGGGKKVCMPSIAARDHTGEIFVGEQGLAYLYRPAQEFRFWNPFDRGRPGVEAGALIDDLLRECGAFEGFMGPCVTVLLDRSADEDLRMAWRTLLVSCGVRKVKFAFRLQVEGTAFLIETEYGGTEMGWFVNGSCSSPAHILYGAQACDEGVRDMVGHRFRVLLHMEDARALRMSASAALWKGKNPVLEVNGMNRYGEYERVRVRALDVWQSFRPVLEQIVLWTADVLDSVSLEGRTLLLQEGLCLRGSLNDCFGLPQMLNERTGFPVRREE